MGPEAKASVRFKGQVMTSSSQSLKLESIMITGGRIATGVESYGSTDGRIVFGNLGPGCIFSTVNATPELCY